MSNAGDVQSKPTSTNVSEDVLDSLRGKVSPEIFAQLSERVEYGERKYGSRLKTYNGRDVVMDCLQESLDGCMYAQQAILEGFPAEELLQDFVSLSKKLIGQRKRFVYGYFDKSGTAAYVGSAWDVLKRDKEHRRKSPAIPFDRVLQRSPSKYSIRVLEEVEGATAQSAREIAAFAENKWMDTCGTWWEKGGQNFQRAVTNFSSQELYSAMAAAKSAAQRTPEFRSKVSGTMKIKWLDPTYRARMRESHIEKKQTQETINKRRLKLVGNSGAKGRARTEEFKLKVSAGMKKYREAKRA
jgi:hypothetical protein